MTTEYDFQNLERGLSSAEKQLADFNKKLANVIQPIQSAKFNSHEYGENAVKQRVNQLISKAKASAANCSDAFIKDILKYSNSAMRDISETAQDVKDYMDSLNQILDSVNQLNITYAGNDFDQTISLAEEMREVCENAEIAQYALLVEINAYDKLCKLKVNRFVKDDYATFQSYYALCERSNAKEHLPSASLLLFLAAHKMITENKSTIPESELYQVSIDGLKGFSGIKSSQKSDLADCYQEVYQCGTALFNKMAQAAHTSFDYISVKKFLADSIYFETADIENVFFADANLTSDRVFDYLKEYGRLGNESSLAAAFDDSKELAVSEKRESFIAYWISNYDTYGWRFCNESINMQENRYLANSLISKIVIENSSSISNLPELALNLYENYYRFLTTQKHIDLDLFLDSAIDINAMLRVFTASDGAAKKRSPLHKAIKGFDGVSYAMITKYSKLCSQYCDAKIENLNAVLDDSSNRLYGKPYRKNLQRDEKKPPLEKIGKNVKFISEQSKKKRNIILIGGAALIIIAIILVLIFLIL